MIDVLELARYLLYLDKERADADGEDAASDMTHLKLQKLLYYCQAYALGLYGEPLFDDNIEAWKNGLVVRSVYKEYSKYGRSCIPHVDSREFNLDERTKNVAGLVTQDKGRYAAWALRDLTHDEEPWQVAYAHGQNTFISREAMQRYFDAKLDDDDDSSSFMNAGERPTTGEWEDINRHVASILHG